MQKKFIVFCLCCIFCFCGFSIISFAYYPVVTVNSGDWNVSSEYSLESLVYPKWSTNHKFLFGSDGVYNGHDNLNGETVYSACDWHDTTVSVTKTVSFPSLPYESTNYDGSAIFRYNDLFILFYTYDRAYIYPTLDSQNILGVYNGIEGNVDIYTLSYPYEEWVLNKTWDTMDHLGNVTSLGAFYDYPSSYVWSDMDVYRYTTLDGTSVLYTASSTPLSSVTSEITYKEPVSVLQGAASVQLSSGDVERLRSGAYCLRIQNFGIVAGTLCNYVISHIGYSLLLNGDVVASGSFFDDNSNSGFTTFGVTSDNPLTSGQSVFYSNLVSFCDLDKNPQDGQSYELRLAFMIQSDAYLCFCPGKFELIEFESYDSDIKHEEMQSAIQEAADVVKGSVDSAKSEISSEIAAASSEIVNSLDDGFNKINGTITEESKSIKEKIVNAADSIKNKLQDVKDGIVNKLEDVKIGLLDGIKKFFIPDETKMQEMHDKWDELFSSRFGALYEVSQIIRDFASELKYTSEQHVITLPAVTVNLSGTDFTFGGYDVDLVPDERLSILLSTLKIITSIVCTLAFLNALKRKYDVLVGDAA